MWEVSSLSLPVILFLSLSLSLSFSLTFFPVPSLSLSPSLSTSLSLSPSLSTYSLSLSHPLSLSLTLSLSLSYYPLRPLQWFFSFFFCLIRILWDFNANNCEDSHDCNIFVRQFWQIRNRFFYVNKYFVIHKK